jgi:hypothetical protein
MIFLIYDWLIKEEPEPGSDNDDEDNDDVEQARIVGNFMSAKGQVYHVLDCVLRWVRPSVAYKQMGQHVGGFPLVLIVPGCVVSMFGGGSGSGQQDPSGKERHNGPTRSAQVAH